MQFQAESVINKPLNRVIELFDDADNLPKWMEGLQSFEHLSGEQGQPGAKSRLVFLINDKSFELIETITVRNLPSEFSGTYSSDQGVENDISHAFIDLGNNQTKIVSENAFRFSGPMKLVAWAMKAVFQKQAQKHLDAFKTFVESQN